MFKISNEMYDFLKRMAMYYLPGIATFVISVFGIWGIPYGEPIAATIMAVDTLLGVFLGISTNKYNNKEEE